MEPAKFCTECGEALPPGAKHCPNCGAEVSDLHLTSPADGQQVAPATPFQAPSPVSAGPFGAAPPSPPQPAQSASYGGPGATPRSPYGIPAPPQAPVAAGYQRARGATAAKRLGGGFIAIIGGLAMLAAQGLFMSKGNALNILNVGLGLLCLVSGIVALVVRGWGPVLVGVLLSGGIFGLCGLKLYQTVMWLQAQPSEVATTWTLQSGGIIWIGGMMLGMVAFTKAFQSLFSRR